MKTDALVVFSCLLALTTFQVIAYSTGRKSFSGSTVILVGLDSFGWDFRYKAYTPYLDWIARTGVSAPYIENVFPTETLPNFVTLVTGLYPESHGLISNNFYDPQLKDHFTLSNTDSKWWSADPIWVTNQKQGHRSGNVYWPGYNVRINGFYPTYTTKDAGYRIPFTDLRGTMPWKERVDTVYKWLTGPNPPNFISLYLEEPDYISHFYGPDSWPTMRTIQEVDRFIGRLRRKLNWARMLHKVNWILTADHGQFPYRGGNVISIEFYTNPGLYEIWGSNFGTVLMINPLETKWKTYVYRQFFQLRYLARHCVNVYRKHRIPKELHFKNNKRVAPILVVAKQGCIVGLYIRGMRAKGIHGYRPVNDRNKYMFPFFMARGPSFKRGHISKPFSTVDVYPLVTHLLGIKPAPNNGSFERVRDLLNPEHLQMTDVKRGYPGHDYSTV